MIDSLPALVNLTISKSFICSQTLTQSERGYPPPIQHVRVPESIQKEKGIDLTAPTTALNKPWHKVRKETICDVIIFLSL